jgi:hypothetical protein
MAGTKAAISLYFSLLTGNFSRRRTVRASLRPPPASLGCSLSCQRSPKNIDFAGRKAASVAGKWTYYLCGPSGSGSTAGFFSARSLGSSLSLEPWNRRISLAKAKRECEFELTVLLPSSLSGFIGHLQIRNSPTGRDCLPVSLDRMMYLMLRWNPPTPRVQISLQWAA